MMTEFFNEKLLLMNKDSFIRTVLFAFVAKYYFLNAKHCQTTSSTASPRRKCKKEILLN